MGTIFMLCCPHHKIDMNQWKRTIETSPLYMQSE